MIGLKTQSGNYLFDHSGIFGFFTGEGNLLRQASQREWEWLYMVITEHNFNDVLYGSEEYEILLSEDIKKGKVIQMGVTPEGHYFITNAPDSCSFYESVTRGFASIPEPFDVEEISTETIKKDYSNFDPRLCNNGGAYGFETRRHYVKVSNKISSFYGYYDREWTTSDFPYCPACGSFNEHGYAPAVVKAGDKVLGYTAEDFTGCETEILIY